MGEWFCSNHPSSGVGKVKREQWVVVNVWFRNTGGGRGGGVGESERGVVMLCWGGTADGEDEGGAVVLSSLCWGGGEDEGVLSYFPLSAGVVVPMEKTRGELSLRRVRFCRIFLSLLG